MGIALSAGKQVEIICTPSNDITKVTSFLYGVKQHGAIKLSVVNIHLYRPYRHRLWHLSIDQILISHKE